jgi:7-carboxy-7-deazaguanine synthase
MSVEEIVALVREQSATHVVITGGEPMIAPGIAELCTVLKKMGRHLTIETAATVPPSGIACDLASLSPKLRHSTPPPGQFGPGWTARHEERRWRPDVVAEWMRDYEYQLKFVVSSEADVDEVEALLARLPVSPPAHRVLLMPEGRRRADLAERTAWLAGLCRDRGYRLAPRLHLEWFGEGRGV